MTQRHIPDTMLPMMKYMEQSRMLELVNQAFPVVIKACEAIKYGGKIEVIADDHSDPVISFGCYEIMPVLAKEHTICEDQWSEKWTVLQLDYYPGVRYYSDMSGEPPSVDVSEVLEDVSLHTAICYCLEKCVRDELNNYFESLEMEAMMNADDEWSNEADQGFKEKL